MKSINKMEEQKMESSVLKTTDILVVEDNDDHFLIVQLIFEQDGPSWKIHRAASIGEARRWIDDHRGQDFLIISDYRLPDGVGLDLIQGAEQPEDLTYPFIIMTGVGSEKLAVSAMQSGAMDYVVKGDDLYRLPQVAVSVLNRWARITERRRSETDLIDYVNNLEKSSSSLDEFIDKIAQYLDTTLTSDHEFNRKHIEDFKNKVANSKRDGSVGTTQSSGMSSNALDLLSKEGLDGAMMVVNLELQKNPQSWEALGAKADILYLSEKYPQAMNASIEALEINPLNALAWNTKGNVLYKLKRYNEAIECYNRAIEISPFFPKSWYNKKLALEVQLKKSMKNMSLRQPPAEKNESKGSGDGKGSGGGRGSGDGKGSGDDKGDGSLRVGIGRIR
jgi:tetratricopeptide (TPR) repeat protein